MKFGYTVLYVNDVPGTVKWYQSTFGFSLKMLHESKQYAELDTGQTTLAFASHEFASSNLDIKTGAPDKKSPSFEIVFVTEDVLYAFENAVNGGAVPRIRPEKKSWGQTVAYVEDLNGFLIELATPMS